MAWLRGYIHVGTATELRMLQPRPSAGLARRDDLYVRMHVLQGLRRRPAAGSLPELRRQFREPPDPARRDAGEVSRFDRADIQTGRLRGGVNLLRSFPRKRESTSSFLILGPLSSQTKCN